MIYQFAQAINIAKGCVMASAMDNETKMAVLEMLNLVDISKTETTSCEWCEGGIHYGEINCFHSEGSPETLLAENWSFCPNCGRSLK